MAKQINHITVVIPNWNGKKFLGKCLDSLEAQTYTSFDIIVVDNGSTDGSVEYLKQDHPTIQIIRLPRNIGFAPAVNKGIEAATGDGVVLMNNDTAADSRWLELMAKRFNASPDNTGFVTSKIIKMGANTLDSTGDFITDWGLAYPRGRGEEDRGQYDGLTTIFSGSGGATLYSAKLFKAIGLFDNRFFAYYEDVDLGFRAQLAGFAGFFEPQARIEHHIGGTSGGLTAFTRYLSIKNSWYLYIKDMPAPLFWRYLPKFLISQALWVLGSIRRRQFGAALRSYGTLIANLPGVLKERRHIQRHRTVSVSYIQQQITKKPLRTALRNRLIGKRA